MPLEPRSISGVYSHESQCILFLLKALWIVLLCYLHLRRSRQMQSVTCAVQDKELKRRANALQFPSLPSFNPHYSYEM